MSALGLSTARVAKYAAKLAVLLRRIDKDLKDVNRDDVERVVAWINNQPHKEWTKHDSKLVLRKSPIRQDRQLHQRHTFAD